MRLRLTEKYLKALHNINSECQIVMLPGETNDNPLSANNIATAMTLYQKLVSKDGVNVTPAQL